MCSYHQPQQIINEKTIPSHGSVFKPRPLHVLGFCYAKLALVYILFVILRPFCPKGKGGEKKAYCLKKKPLLADL